MREPEVSSARSALAGQVLAVMMALMSVLTKYMLRSLNLSTPAFQNSLGYGMTCLLFLPGFALQKGEGIAVAWRRIVAMFIIAVIDSQASYQANLAFRYGVPVASAGMLSSFTIPCVMVLSFMFLDVRYMGTHFLGIAVALVGFAMVCFTDAGQQPLHPTQSSIANNTTGTSPYLSKPLMGDILVLTASATYAVSNVFSEGYVKTHSVYEYLVFVGFFGAAISFGQVLFLGELNMHRRALTSNKAEACFTAYAVLFAAVMYASNKFMEKFDALVFNLSILTTGFWTSVFGYFLFQESLPPLKVLGYIGVILGMYTYHRTKVTRRHTSEEAPLVNV